MLTLVKVDANIAQHLPDPQNVSTADSLDEAIDVVGRNIHPHQLRVAESRGASLMCLTSALDLGDCALGYVQYGFDVEIDPGIIAEFLLVKSTISGEGRVKCGNQSKASTSRTLIMTSMTERTSILMTAQCRHLTARVSRHALEARIAEKLGRRLTAPLQFGMEVPSDSDFGRGWHQLLGHICHLSASAPTVLASEDVRKQYSRTMVELLVHAAPHNYSAALEGTMNHAIPWHVRRARAYIHTHIAEIRSVADIAAAVGITTRTLQNGFRQAFNMTPAEYVRHTRVQALHQALIAADAGESVTDLMQGLGVVNFGRFAYYYRQKIGVTPSATLKRTI